ncbi:MAG: hypothetical protein ACE5HS_17605 [bacterium]
MNDVTTEQIRSFRQQKKTTIPDYAFQRLSDSVGHLDFRRMHDLEKFETFLQETFDEKQRRPIQGLIIDLHKSGGGATSLGHTLLSYITDKPYRMIARMEVKVSKQKERDLRK